MKQLENMAQSTSQPKISLIIPTLNAETEIGALLHSLQNQTLTPDEIIVVDSASDDATASIVTKSAAGSPFPIRLIEIARKDFDHGGTRHMAFEGSIGDFVLFMTQDAVPANERYIAELTAPLANPQVAACSGRQLPKPDARRFEQLVRGFNYPAESFTRGIEDLDRYGIKTFYTTDVCSAYRRSAYLECGGFPSPCMMSEDMYMAAKLVARGYKVAYAAPAEVYHSHNLTPAQQFARNKAIGAFLEENADVLMHASEISTGKRLVKDVSKTLLSERRIGELCAFGIDCAARLLGNKAGHRQAKGRR